jgi:hypothetical protein
MMVKENEKKQNNDEKDESASVLNVDLAELEMISAMIQPGGDPNISPTAGNPLI